MFKTREQLVLRALLELGIPGAGQAPSAEDAKVVDDEVGPVLSDLAKRGVYNYGDPDKIDEDAFVHLAVILANSVSAHFGQPQDEAVRVYREARLRDLNYYLAPSRPIRVQYF